MSEWQPIETAPKEKMLLGYTKDGAVIVMTWESQAYDCPELDGWCQWVNEDDYGTPAFPTHWMPLPDPPKAMAD